MTGTAANLAELVQSPEIARIADRHGDRVWRALVDTVAVAFAAERTREPAMLRAYLPGGGSASNWVTGEAYPPEQAAMLNAATAHVLDYDDVCTRMRLHPSVVLLPAIVALAQDGGATGGECATAYAAGYEVLARLASGLLDPMFARGWHGTSTLGTVGAAAACSRLLGLPVAQTRHALALAAAYAGGSRESFGTTGKFLQVGAACGNGLRAARLAELGATGAGGLLGPFAGLTGEEFVARAAPQDASWSALDRYPEELKRYPSCLATHAAIDCATELRERVPVDRITSVAVVTNPTGLAALPYPDPKGALQAKFSMPYVVASALVDGGVGLRTFDESRLSRAGVRSLARRVTASEAADGSARERWTAVEVRGPRTLERAERRYRGDDRPAESKDAHLRAKLEDCLAYTGRPAGASQLFADRPQWRDRPVVEVINRIGGTQ